MEKNYTDVLIIGAGIAGLTSAILLSEKGYEVSILFDSDDQFRSSSYLAQGGIIYKGINDNPELLKEDILLAGNNLNYVPAVEKLVENSSDIVKKILIEKIGVNFSKNNGELEFTGEAAHSVKRILFVKDYTGKAIVDGLFDYIKLKNLPIKLFPEHYAIDLITLSHSTSDQYSMYRDDHCYGAYAYHVKTNKVITFQAKYTILATGGMGQIYLHTTNPGNLYGNGYAMAQRAHVKIINMEYTQFHPTSLYSDHGNSFLISEAVRGEGAELVNIKGEPFMKNYHPLGSLAPRDIVARSILFEMQKTDAKFAFLDISRIRKKIKERFPSIYKKCLENGIDLNSENIPVVPSFHFQCGGIKVDLEGETSLNGLYAIGETSCTGIHGANRLASTSLLEGLTWAKFASDSIDKKIRGNEFEQYIQLSDTIKEWEYTGREEYDPILVKQDLTYLKNIMWNYVGPIRSKKRLRRALSDITNLKNTFDDFYYESMLSIAILQLRDAITSASIVATAAWKNKISMGCHYRIN